MDESDVKPDWCVQVVRASSAKNMLENPGDEYNENKAGLDVEVPVLDGWLTGGLLRLGWVRGAVSSDR